MDLGLAAGAVVLLAIVAFRRARNVRTPEARRSAARRSRGTRSRRVVTAVLTVARAAVGIAALLGIGWLTWALFR